jgi:hypothetical protein
VSALIAGRIWKDRHFRIEPIRAGRLKRKPYVIGFDSEAEHGRPFMFQFSLPDESEQEAHLLSIGRGKFAGLNAFMDVIHNVCMRRDREYIVFGFNLTYEFTQLFRDVEPFIRLADAFIIPYTYNMDGQWADYTIRVFNNKRHYASIRNDRTHVVVRLLDAASFFPTSLDKAAHSIGITGKLDKPIFTRRQARTKAFREYARRDAYITRLLGEQIIRWHEQYDVRTCISAPHFASSVFRRKFLQARIPLARPRELEQYGLYSYHGGKNGYYHDGPTELPNVYNYDIRSAYPEAMRQLPDPEQAEWQRVDDYQPGGHGVYRIVGEYRRCKFRGMQTLDGSWNTPSGIVDAAYLTSYEIDAMLQRGELVIHHADGWRIDPDSPSGGPLAAYVDMFFEQKRNATDDTLRLLAKLLLNSLYGKFFQKVPLGDVGIGIIQADGELGWHLSNPEQSHDYKAGGLYHPPIASLITGFVRAKIHGLEHRYDAIMTSTDGLFAFASPDPSVIGTDLGMLDVTRGRLQIWRERLYVFDGDDGKRKYALHGFRGSVDDLLRIPLTRGRFDYSGQQVVTLALSTRRLNGVRYDPGTFAQLPFVLDLTA